MTQEDIDNRAQYIRGRLDEADYALKNSRVGVVPDKTIEALLYACQSLNSRVAELEKALASARGATTKDRDAFNAAFNRGFAGDALR